MHMSAQISAATHLQRRDSSYSSLWVAIIMVWRICAHAACAPVRAHGAASSCSRSRHRAGSLPQAARRLPPSPVATALPGQRHFSARGSVEASSPPQRRSKLSSGPDARTTIPPLQWPNWTAGRPHRAPDRLICSIRRGSGGGAAWVARVRKPLDWGVLKGRKLGL